jgi:hypothetical protein
MYFVHYVDMTTTGDVAFTVTGEMSTAQSTDVKHFVHSFVISGEKPYYVEAEMLRFVNLPAAPVASVADAATPAPAALPTVTPSSPQRTAVAAPVQPSPAGVPIASPVSAPASPVVAAVSSPVKKPVAAPVVPPATSPVSKPVAAPVRQQQQQSRARTASSGSAKSVGKSVGKSAAAATQKKEKPVVAAAKPAAPPAPETPKKPSGPISWATIASKPSPVPAPVAAPTAPVAKKEEAPAAASPAKPRSDAPPAVSAEPNVIFVRGFPVGTKNVQLNALFKQFGALDRVEIMEMRTANVLNAFAYIHFKEVSSATKAVASPGLKLNELTLTYALKTATERMPVGARPPRNSYSNRGGYRGARRGGRSDGRREHGERTSRPGGGANGPPAGSAVAAGGRR